jgi:hypothetical protein
MINIIKQLIVYTLYYIGHFISLLFKLRMNFLYPIYNWCMIKSSDLQDKYKLYRPWIKIPQKGDLILIPDWYKEDFNLASNLVEVKSINIDSTVAHWKCKSTMLGTCNSGFSISDLNYIYDKEYQWELNDKNWD